MQTRVKEQVPRQRHATCFCRCFD